MDLKIFIFMTAIVVCCSAAPRVYSVPEEDQHYVKQVLQDVPELERKQFVIHQLYKGYILTHPNDVAINVPTETTERLYELFLKNYIITPTDTQLFDQLCFPSGECVDTDDPGVYP